MDTYKKIILKLEDENKDINSKIHILEKENDSIKAKCKEFKDKSKNADDIKKQNVDLRKKFEDSLKLVENLQVRYENLVESSMAFEEKTRELYKANQILQDNIIKLLPDA